MIELNITMNHTGKMKGMQSLSTSCASNPLCLKNKEIAGSICEKCYAQTMMRMYPNLRMAEDRNAAILKEAIILPEDLPYINAAFFRLEAFGDLHNANHLSNYVALAQKNAHCRFALWSKNYSVLLDYFAQNKLPPNLNIIVSSLMMNRPVDVSRFKEIGLPVKTFTVYTKEYVQANHIEINCGGKSCAACLLCYKENAVTEIRELLKSDQRKKEALA